MKAEERRNAVSAYIKQQTAPVSATVLAGEFGVSRQIIVGDVALLRATGEKITSTPRGYVYEASESEGIHHQIACSHSSEETELELQIFVDNGCVVKDVVVEHPVYGQIVASLEISNRFEAKQFVEQVKELGAHSLSELTDGIHLHTIKCPNDQAFVRVCNDLRDKGLLVE